MGIRLFKCIKNWFIRKWEPSEILFSIFLVEFFTFGTFIFTLRVEHIGGAVMIYSVIMSGVFLLCAILTIIRINMKPEDKRLDTLITSVTALTTAVNTGFSNLNTKMDNLLQNSIDRDTANQLKIAIQELTEELKKRNTNTTQKE